MALLASVDSAPPHLFLSQPGLYSTAEPQAPRHRPPCFCSATSEHHPTSPILAPISPSLCSLNHRLPLFTSPFLHNQ
ncbi:hypothetical protein PIB30_087442, partial [Stylosanthes scabra]|nr:hypothetical protein [Stylosanthes scabra]